MSCRDQRQSLRGEILGKELTLTPAAVTARKIVGPELNRGCEPDGSAHRSMPATVELLACLQIQSLLGAPGWTRREVVKMFSRIHCAQICSLIPQFV